MAIYSFRVSIIKRSEGRSSVASAAYRAAEELADKRSGQTHDYTRKGGVLHSEILTPENAPDWASNREKLWNAVEAVETRVNAQTAREFTFALPHEISDQERRALVREFLMEECVSKGMVVDYALHLPDKEGDQRNHHAHAMLTMREIDQSGFTRKAREWNSRGQLEHWRSAWADHVNRALERAGRPERVDHRTLEAQGEDLEPTIHEGPTVTAMTRDGFLMDAAQSNEDKRRRNALLEQFKEQFREMSLKIERPELARALEIIEVKNPSLPQAFKALQEADRQNTGLNEVRRQIAHERKVIYHHAKLSENLKKHDEAVKGGFATMYRKPSHAQAIFLQNCITKNGNPNKAARLLKATPAKYGRLKGWAIGNLWYSRERKEALAVKAILAEKARIAEYTRRKLETASRGIDGAKDRYEVLNRRKRRLEREPTPMRLIAQRQIHKAAKGFDDKAWKALSWQEQKTIAEARRAMKSDPVKRYADREYDVVWSNIVREQQQRQELERKRERDKDKGWER